MLAARFPGQSDEEVLAATVEAAVAAERAGFDDVWLAEHHFMSYGICPSAVTLAAYVLGSTRRVAVGTAVSVLSATHPVALAEQAGDSRADARRLLRRQLPRWLGPGLAGYMPVDGRPRPARDPDRYAELLCRIHPVGTAADCARIMAATAQGTRIGHLICTVEGAGDPAAVRENIARLGAEVLPLLPGRISSRPTPGAG